MPRSRAACSTSPFAPTTSSEPSGTSSVAEAAAPITVLLIDDHRMFSDSLTRLLRDEEGIEVIGAAATGEEGVRAATELEPAVVLLDYQLPDRDGVSVATEI